jgi:hypothetical protein
MVFADPDPGEVHIVSWISLLNMLKPPILRSTTKATPFLLISAPGHRLRSQWIVYRWLFRTA